MYVTKSIKRIRMQRDRKVALLTYYTFRLLGVGIVVSKGFLCVCLAKHRINFTCFRCPMHDLKQSKKRSKAKYSISTEWLIRHVRENYDYYLDRQKCHSRTMCLLNCLLRSDLKKCMYVLIRFFKTYA